jgi:ribosome maturation factor RimP
MIAKSKIDALVQEYLTDKDIFLVDCLVSTGNKIQVFVDSLAGLSVKDCVNLSRHIESSLNREEEDFELEVSSPGADVPFKVPAQYQKNIGRKLKVIDKEGKEYQGKLFAFDGNIITLESNSTKKNQKSKITETLNLELDKVKQASVILSFK